MLEFKEVAVTSEDARMLIAQLNAVLTGIIGNDGTGHVNNADFGAERGTFIIGYDAGRPVCCAGLRCAGPDTAEVKRVYAQSNHSGYGSRLMTAIEETALGYGYDKLILECRTANPAAIEFYKRQGYSVCAQFPPYEGVTDAVCMDKKLK